LVLPDVTPEQKLLTRQRSIVDFCSEGTRLFKRLCRFLELATAACPQQAAREAD
jgi:hypothetical protein